MKIRTLFCLTLLVSMLGTFGSCTERAPANLSWETFTFAETGESVVLPQEDLSVYQISGFSEARKKSEVSVTVSGCKPGEMLYLALEYSSGWSGVKGTGEGVADENGVVCWTWKISGSVKVGSTPRVLIMNCFGKEIHSFRFLITEAQE